jgi:hypothetical protein
MPSAGTLKNLTLVGYGNAAYPLSAPFSVTAQVMINGVATALSCTITVASVSQPIPCTDRTDTASVNAWDMVTVQMITPPPVGVTAATMTMYVSLEKQ